ncbi:MAG: cell division protein ZapA (FtsZ GTPase activity inhibitor) [Candidatus Paceibacteria bacterium]|jgi:cell division protein ZapA (FtsZ GTPase activity inhibitor)
MSNQLKIKLSIADRVYPLTIHPDQEEGLRKAAKKIESMIKKFENSYAVRDKQDVLAMSALQFAAQVEQKNIETIEGGETIVQKIQALNDLLQHQLS